MALEWTQQLLEDARGFMREKCRGQWREAKSEQEWSAKKEQRNTIMYHYGIV